MLSLVSKALASIFRNPESAFLTAKVNDILFNGLLINCTVTDFAAKAVCTQLKAEAEGLKFQTETEYLFSLLGPVFFKILCGKKYFKCNNSRKMLLMAKELKFIEELKMLMIWVELLNIIMRR